MYKDILLRQKQGIGDDKMPHRAAGSISFFLYQKGMIEKDDMDIYQYGFEIFIDSFLEIIMLLLLGILWRKLPETVAFVDRLKYCAVI